MKILKRGKNLFSRSFKTEFYLPKVELEKKVEQLTNSILENSEDDNISNIKHLIIYLTENNEMEEAKKWAKYLKEQSEPKSYLQYLNIYFDLKQNRYIEEVDITNFLEIVGKTLKKELCLLLYVIGLESYNQNHHNSARYFFSTVVKTLIQQHEKEVDIEEDRLLNEKLNSISLDEDEGDDLEINPDVPMNDFFFYSYNGLLSASLGSTEDVLDMKNTTQKFTYKAFNILFSDPLFLGKEMKDQRAYFEYLVNLTHLYYYTKNENLEALVEEGKLWRDKLLTQDPNDIFVKRQSIKLSYYYCLNLIKNERYNEAQEEFTNVLFQCVQWNNEKKFYFELVKLNLLGARIYHHLGKKDIAKGFITTAEEDLKDVNLVDLTILHQKKEEVEKLIE